MMKEEQKSREWTARRTQEHCHTYVHSRTCNLFSDTPVPTHRRHPKTAETDKIPLPEFSH